MEAMREGGSAGVGSRHSGIKEESIMTRRLITLVAAPPALLMRGTTGAYAHERYNASRSATGDAHAVNGQALVSYDELLDLLCPAGDALVAAAAGAAPLAPPRRGPGARETRSKPTVSSSTRMR